MDSNQTMIIYKNALWYDEPDKYKDPNEYFYTLPIPNDVEFEDVTISMNKGFDQRYMKYDEVTREISFDKRKILR